MFIWVEEKGSLDSDLTTKEEDELDIMISVCASNQRLARAKEQI